MTNPYPRWPIGLCRQGPSLAAMATPLLALVLLLAGAGSGWAQRQVLVDRVRISVNDKVMTAREVQEIQEIRTKQLAASYQGEALQTHLKELESSLIQTLVEDLLLESHAEILKIEITDKEIEERVTSITRREPKMAEIYGEEQLKSFVLKDLLRTRVVRQEVEAYLAINEADLRQACLTREQENRVLDLGHILLRGDGAVAQLKDLRRRLEAGENFEELALAFSQDPSAKRNKGRLGFVSRGQFVKPFEEKAFSMQPGEISDPVQTQFGHHLIKVFGEREKKGVDCNALDDVTRQTLTNQMTAERRQTRMTDFLKRLKDDAEIRVYN